MSASLISAGLALAALVPPLDSTPDARVRRPPAFGVALDVVALNVSVTDDRNRFVANLSESDFAVFEDGVPQRPFLFEREDVPISLVLMIDASGSMTEQLGAARQAALRLVRTLGRRDSAQVVGFDARTRLLQDFTTDKTLIEEAIQGVRTGGETALRNAVYDVLGRAARRREGAEPRRWAVVLLSDGADTRSLVREDDVLEAARESDLTIHTIGFWPRRPLGGERLALGRAAHFLAELAYATGGEAFLPRSPSELEGLYDRIADALRTQYVLGYSPANARCESGWRRIQVRVPGRPGLAARHRPGYYAPRK